MPPKSRSRATATESQIDAWQTYLAHLAEQSQQSLRSLQRHSNEMMSVAKETLTATEQPNLVKYLIDATNVWMSFHADQCQSWCDFCKATHGEWPPKTPERRTVQDIQKVSFQIDQFTETCEAQIITYDPARIPGLSATALGGSNPAFSIPADNVRLTTLGSEPPNVYVSLIDMQQLLSQANGALPVGTYSGEIAFGSTSVATVEVILTQASCP